MLRTDHKTSLAATIELSLASPTFEELGPDARELLGVVAFFPQGVDENDLEWLFPTVADVTTIFDKFCILSLTHKSNGFVTMLAPLRDHFRPKDPMSSSLLRTTKGCYFTRLSVEHDFNKPGCGETLHARWIVSEDVNIEHLLDVFSSIDADSTDVWVACADFMRHLFWYKPRGTVLGLKIEGLLDDHPSKPECLCQLSRLFGSVGNRTEEKRLRSYALKLERERGDENAVAHTLTALSDTNLKLGLYEEGIEQAKEALGLYEQLEDTAGRANCLDKLSWLLHENGQLDAAEEVATHMVNLLPEQGQEFLVCRSHRTLGRIYSSKGMKDKGLHHFEVALGIASLLGLSKEVSWIHLSLAQLLCEQCRFDDARAHVERAKSHAVDDLYCLGYTTLLHAVIWCVQRRPQEATSEALHAREISERLGNAGFRKTCEGILRTIQEVATIMQSASDEPGSNGELSEKMFHLTPVDSPFSATGVPSGTSTGSPTA